MMQNFAKMVGITISLFPILPHTLPAQVKILTDYKRLTIADGLSNYAVYCYRLFTT
ncbi:MAG: hypothetical protein ACRENG_03190 [bacterium]